MSEQNSQYRLQLRSHKELFANRMEAVDYIKTWFQPDCLVGEPTLYFYGNAKRPDVILAVGTGERKVAMIDIARTDEKLCELSEVVELNKTELAHTVKTLMNVIDVCGLTYDENKIDNQVTYEPDSKDALIADAKTITEAIAIISQYVQETFYNEKLNVADTKSVSMLYDVNEGGGMLLRATVNISSYGESDTDADNNNIIGLKADGIYATSDLEYDEEKHTLTFTASGMKDGRFMDDAKKKVIHLGEHSEYIAMNDNHNIQLTVTKIDASHSYISADAKLSEDSDNILTVRDGKLLVDGRAKNIKYKDTNVYQGINRLENEVSTINDTIEVLKRDNFIGGEETDTAIVNAKKMANGGYTISTDVRLSNNESIIVEQGGLAVNMEITSDTTLNKLIVRIGNQTTEVALPGVNIIENIYYDAPTKTIHVVLAGGGADLLIPVGDMLKLWIVENSNASPVVLNKREGTEAGDPEVLSASLRLRSTDNTLAVDANGALYSPKSIITNAVAEETARAEASEKKNADAIAAESVARTEADSELQGAIDVNAKAIVAEETRAKTAETALDNRISALDTKVDGEIARAKDAEILLKTSIEENAEAINVLNGDDATVNSVRYIVKHTADHLNGRIDGEIARATAAENQIAADAKAYTDAEVQKHIAGMDSEVERLNKLISDEIEDRQDGDATLKSNIEAEIARATAAEAQALADAKAYTDAEVQKHIVDVENEVEKLNKLVSDNSQSIIDEELARIAEDDAINKRIADEVARATAAEQALAEEVSKKANALDVYTKEMADGKFATKDSVGTSYALKSDLDAEINTARAAEKANADAITLNKEAIAEHTNDIEQLKKENARLTLNVSETDSLRMIVSKSDTGTSLSADVKVVAEGGNIIQVTGNGLFATVALSYNKAENILTLDNGISSTDIKLSDHSLVTKGYYDVDSKSIVLTITKDGGETEDIVIPVADLIEDWDVQNTPDNPIQLSKSASEGIDMLSVALNISTSSDNILTNDAGTLFVSGKAENHTALWDGNVITVQQAIERLRDVIEETDAKIEAEIASLKAQDIVLDGKINTESVERTNADSALQGAINAEIVRAKEVEGTLATSIADEVARATAAEQTNASNIQSVNNALTAEVTRAKDAEKANADAITLINANALTEGSAAYKAAQALAEAKAYADGLDGAMDARMDVIEDSVAILNGNESVEGSVKKALADAKVYTDAETARATAAEQALTEEVSKKANADEVYSKTASDEKFATINGVADGYATKTALSDEVARAKDAEKANADAINAVSTLANTNASDIDKVEAEVVRLNLSTTESDTIKLNVSKSDVGTTISGDVKVDGSATNIIQRNGNGLFASVTLSYNTAENALTFNNGTGEQKIILTDNNSLVTDGYYDSETKSIILVITKDGGAEQIRIPVGDIINDWTVVNDADSPIKLTKTTNADGVDILSADLVISVAEDNLILDNNGTLYASRKAENHTAHWTGETVDITVQEAINRLHAETDKIVGIESDIEALENGLNAANLAIVNSLAEAKTYTDTKVKEVDDKVDALTADLSQTKIDVAAQGTEVERLRNEVANVQTGLTENNAKVDQLNGNVIELTEKFGVLQGEVNTYSDRIENVENAIINSNEAVTNLDVRVTALENVIDCGTYA